MGTIAAGPGPGTPLESPENTGAPGVARPSSLVGGGDQNPQSPGSMPEPNRQLTQVLGRVQQMGSQIEQLAASYPAAASFLRKAKDNLDKAMSQIASSGPGGQSETPSPRMLG